MAARFVRFFFATEERGPAKKLAGRQGAMLKKFKDLTEKEILAIAIAAEEEDGRIYGEFADALREDYPSTAQMFEEMREEEVGHELRCAPRLLQGKRPEEQVLRAHGARHELVHEVRDSHAQGQAPVGQHEPAELLTAAQAARVAEARGILRP